MAGYHTPDESSHAVLAHRTTKGHGTMYGDISSARLVGDTMQPFDTRREAFKRARNHYAAATDRSLSWEARQWHAAMYAKQTGQHIRVWGMD